ncbi:cobalamin trafficking protein CblD-like [Stegodyphus dumicola]|uniref:cobalamin trafficking protein CblD-like n=1 Tax=Stegodyphus dumicola TaxID=202533 RepID=UPI0015ACD524|nr:cobalamin trafficking protein CblD-like [Stegodyphus dumicola]
MITVSKKISNFRNLAYLTRCYRTIYSGKIPQSPLNTSFEDSSSNGLKKEGYGEKEIFLLGPADLRTPLPGNTGIPPLSMIYTNRIKELPNQREILSTPQKIDCAAHDCPVLLKKDFADLFPNRNLSNDNLTVLTLCQKTENDMSSWSEDAEVEREELETFFVTAANTICAHLKRSGYWADFIHPNSGKPHFNPVTDAVMFATDLRYRRLGFTIDDLGCCRIISHAIWGTHVFVGAIFTNASLESSEIQEIVAVHKPVHSPSKN